MLGAGSASEVLERAAKRAARIALMDSCGLESEQKSFYIYSYLFINHL